MSRQKGANTSATAATRKKHAKKAGKDQDDVDVKAPPQRGQKKGPNGKKLSKAQRKALPKIKQYIPPPKPPAPPIPDPLDGLGLARTLPAELVVILRRLGKKDDVTRRKGLDELREQWITPLLQTPTTEDEEIERDIKEAAVLAAIPVWVHNLASLLQSPSHRGVALQLHDDLLMVPEIRGAIVDGIALAYLPGTQDRDVLGSWLVAALEEGRRGGGQALKMWDETAMFGSVTTDSSDSAYTKQFDITPHLSALAEYLSLSILDPQTLHRDIHPPPIQSAFNAPAGKEIKSAKGGKNAKGRPTPVATPPPPQPEEDPEVAEERWTRYRVGGLVGLAWLLQKLAATGVVALPEDLMALLSNPVLWSALGTSSHLPDLVPIGQYPPIRRAAYNLLAAFMDSYPAEVERPDMLQLLSATVLGNCWAEKESVVWESAGPTIVKFLAKYRQSWELAAALSSSDAPDSGGDINGDDDDDDDDDDDNDDDEDEDDDETEPPSRTDTPSGAATPARVSSSKAFDAFLKFISTICPTVPHLTYPLLIVVISTLPASILPLASGPSIPLQNLFSHLWSPVDARLLSTHTLGRQASSFQAFLQSAVEATLYLITKAHAAGEAETAEYLVNDQLGNRVWAEGVITMGAKGGRRGESPVETEAKIAARAIPTLLGLGGELVVPFLNNVARSTLAACFPVEAGKQVAFLPRSLNALTALRAAPAVEKPIDDIILKIAEGCTERLFDLLPENAAAASSQAEALVGILIARKDLFPEEGVEVLSQGLQAHFPEIVAALTPNLVAALFDATVAVASQSESNALRHVLWSYVKSDAPQTARFATLTGILESRSEGLLVEASLDEIAAEAARAALATDDPTALAIAKTSISSKGWLSMEKRDQILNHGRGIIHECVDDLLTVGGGSKVPLTALEMLKSYAESVDKIVLYDLCVTALVAVHHLVVLLPRVRSDIPIPDTATWLWKVAGHLTVDHKMALAKGVSSSLAELLGRVNCRADPGVLVDVALATDLGQSPTPAAVVATLLPPADDLLAILDKHMSQPPHPTLSVIDPLVPVVSEIPESIARPSDYDPAGRSRAARFAEAALALLRADRNLVSSHASLLHVALGAMLLCEDGAAIPGAARGLYNAEASAMHLAQVVRDAEGALSFSLALVDEVSLAWHKAAVEQLRAGKPAPNADYLQRLFSELRSEVEAKDGDIAPRAFREVLARHLQKCGAGEAEGEVWLNYAMAMSEKMPDISLAVIHAIKPLMLESKAFATAQNRLANALTGVSVKNANEKGIPALRLLVASAPPADAAAVFIPQQRAVFALRHVGGWLTSEDEAADDLADEIDLRIAELYTAVAPVVQDLPGGHWDAIFDLVEGALSSCSLEDQTSYPLLYAGLCLLREIRDLCQTNKALRASWVDKDAHMTLVVQLFLQCRDANSVPLQMIHALVLDLLQDASDKVMAKAGLSELCDLLRLSTSATIQTTAYRLLSKVVRANTLALVIEVEATVSDEPESGQRQITLPAELIAIVEAGKDVDWHTDPRSEIVLGQLLAWMAIMDHFDDASRTLRWAYLDQLNSSRLLEESLLPLLFAMLGVSEVGAWNFGAMQYAVDEFYPDLLEPEELCDLSPLASHVYYRALVTIPSAMRTYYESLKDRQLSLSLLTFTAKNYSPVIIQHEFSALREVRALAALTEEGLSVRIAQGGGASVAGAGAAEAIASYVVDEQPMEIGIRLPAEFPLRAVDVRDLRRVGVPENKWRGWLMSVQQTITSRNGLILEALTVFKKNVALHFEGVVECAICYSIISLTDRTLPTKPCRTCKNRFHGSCLFKWFNSSHSSSCPMCRSLF